MTDVPEVQVQFAAEFRAQLRSLAKRYRQIRSDVQPLIEKLQAGEFPGDQISGTGYTIFKVRRIAIFAKANSQAIELFIKLLNQVPFCYC